MENEMLELFSNNLIVEGLVLNRDAVGRAIYNEKAVSQLVARKAQESGRCDAINGRYCFETEGH
jgi:hypothetical protein